MTAGTLTRTTRRLACVLAAGVALAMVPASPAGATENSAALLYSYTNSARAAVGLHGLSVRSDLAAIAYGQSRRMASSGKLYHNPNLYTEVKNWRMVGENVGFGPSASGLQKAFMGSAPHRANILRAGFTEMGIAAVWVGSTVWVTEVFRQPMSSAPSTAVVRRPTAVVHHPSVRAAAPRARPAAKQVRHSAAPPSRRVTTRHTAPVAAAVRPSAPARPVPAATRSVVRKAAIRASAPVLVSLPAHPTGMAGLLVDLGLAPGTKGLGDLLATREGRNLAVAVTGTLLVGAW